MSEDIQGRRGADEGATRKRRRGGERDAARRPKPSSGQQCASRASTHGANIALDAGIILAALLVVEVCAAISAGGGSAHARFGCSSGSENVWPSWRCKDAMAAPELPGKSRLTRSSSAIAPSLPTVSNFQRQLTGSGGPGAR